MYVYFADPLQIQQCVLFELSMSTSCVCTLQTLYRYITRTFWTYFLNPLSKLEVCPLCRPFTGTTMYTFWTNSLWVHHVCLLCRLFTGTTMYAFWTLFEYIMCVYFADPLQIQQCILFEPFLKTSCVSTLQTVYRYNNVYFLNSF